MFMKCFTGGGSEGIWYSYTVSTILAVGQAAKPYLPAQPAIVSSRRSAHCKMILLHI